jgi:uncharacterized protein YjiS (DUF1127 family)
MTTIDMNIAGEAGRQTRLTLLEQAEAVLNGFSAIMIAVQDWQYRARERRQLRGLSDRALSDFGASRADSEHEGSKPFWR